MSPIERVLDLARWAPSGDNTQPWRFQIVSDLEALIHTFDTRRHCVYDLTGGPSQISVGAMLETARIAASGLSARAEIERLPTPSDEKLLFRVRLIGDSPPAPNPLLAFIEKRCTHRQPYSRRVLTPGEKSTLAASVGSDYSLLWLEGRKRRDAAWLMFESAKIRLTIREAYLVHASVIEWNARFSESKIPDQAVGLDPVGLALMRWAMKSWTRVDALNRYLGGTLLPRIQMDLMPALGCAAHVAIIAKCDPGGIDEYLAIGGAVQQFWLTATKLGLGLQPELTPLIFGEYARKGISFAADVAAARMAARVARKISNLLGDLNAPNAVWLCRIGEVSAPSARSLRRPLSELIVRTPF